MASSSSGHQANVVPQHQVWGQVETLAETGSDSNSTNLRSNSSIHDVQWQSNSTCSSAVDVPDVPAEPDSPGGEDLDLPSIGSKGHAIGKCKQCYYFNTEQGCGKGRDCSFCHMHTKKCRLRPGKSSRALAKSRAQALDTANDAEEIKQTAVKLLSQNQSQYMQAVVKKKLALKEVQFPVEAGDSETSSMEEKSGNSQDSERSAPRKRNLIRL